MLADQRAHFGMAGATTLAFNRVVKSEDKTKAEELYEATFDAAQPAMLTNAVSGLLEKDRTLRFLAGMHGEIKHIRNKIEVDHSIPESLKARLKKELDGILDVMNQANTQCAQENENGHKILRDCFDKVASRSKKIAALTGGGTLGSSGSVASAGQAGSLPKLGRYFSDLAQLSVELKRFHYTNWASFAVDNYARKCVDQMAKYAPGLSRQRTGSESVRGSELGLSLRLLSLNRRAQCGPVGSLKLQFENKEISDEDKDHVVFVTSKLTGRLGAIAKFGSLFPSNTANKGGHSFSLFGNGKLSWTQGSYHDHNDPLASTKASVQRESNKWRLLCPSGKPDAFSNRMYAKAGNACNAVKKFMGVISVPLPGMPNVNQKKLDKGAWNNWKVMELAGRLGDNLPLPYTGPAGQSIADLVRGAYGMVDTIDLAKKDLCGAEGIAAPAVHNALQKTSPLPSPFNRQTSFWRESIQRKAAGAEIGGNFSALDMIHPQPGQMRVGGSAGLSYERSANLIEFRRVKAPHEHLDPAYNKDMGSAYRALRQLESKQQGQPKMHTYQAIGKMLSANVAEWQHDVNVQSGLKLDSADAALDHIKITYRRFMHVASMMKSLQDSSYRKSLPDRGAAAEAQFDALARDLFGIEKFSSPEKRKFIAGLRKDPRRFMREGYDALSISLGRVGADLYETKKQIHDRCDPGHHCATQLWEATRETDVKYASVRRLMDGIFLPISEEDLFRGASIVADSNSRNTTYISGGEAMMGAWMSPLQYAPGNFADPTAPSDKGPINPVGAVSLANVAAIGGSFSVGTRIADEHPNPVRSGTYTNTRFGGKANGLAALFAGGVIRSWYKKFQLSSGSTQSNEESKLKKFLHETGLITQRMMLADYSQEFSVETNHRTPQSVGKYHYEKSLQYSRIAGKEAIAFNATLAAPLHAIGHPGTIAFSGGTSQSASNVLVETMGSCPSYHMLQFVELKNLFKVCQFKKEALGDDQAERDRKAVDYQNLDQKKLSSQVDFNMMRNMLAPSDPKDYVGSTSVDAGYLLNKYFGTEETILGFMDKFMRYGETRREIGGPPREFNGERTEFHRFDDNEDFFKVIQNMRTCEKYAPGSLLNTSLAYAPSDSQFRAAVTNDARPTVDTVAVAAQMHAVKRLFLERPNMTPAERAAVFLDEGGPGREVFETYIQVLSAYTDIHNAIKPANTYELRGIGPNEIAN